MEDAAHDDDLRLPSARRRRTASFEREGDVPAGWTRLLPADSNNAYPVTPPTSSAVSAHQSARQYAQKRRQRQVHGPDALGLSQALAPAHLLRRELRVREHLHASAASSSAARSSPRHLKLVKKQQPMQLTSPAVSSDESTRAATAAFSPLRSSRIARLRHHSPTIEGTRVLSPTTTCNHRDASADDRQQQQLGSREASDLPLHELIRTVDDAVSADPFVDSSQAAITRAFVAQWLARFDASRHHYKSVAVHAEVGFQELYRLTANVSSPNELTTAFACKVLRDLAPHFGPYASLVGVLCAELHLSIYSPASSLSLPYFAIVKNQKQLVIALRKDKARRRERNELLAREITKVRHMFHHFLDATSAGLVRTIFREWYSFAVVRKKNSRKYIECFSMWFTGSAKALVPKLFASWKHEVMQRKMDRMQAQLIADAEKLTALQRQIDDMTLQRDVAQLESLAIRNDRKQAEDMIQRLNRKVEAAGSYLEGSFRREGLVCVEGQLRAEAVSFLPPLVLESLLRGYHNVGFLQQVHSEFIPKPSSTTTTLGPSQRKTSNLASVEIGAEDVLAHRQSSALQTPADAEQRRTPATSMTTSFGTLAPRGQPTVLQDCLAEIVKMRGASVLATQSQSRDPSAPKPVGDKRSDLSSPTSASPSVAVQELAIQGAAAGASPSSAAQPPAGISDISFHNFAAQFQSIQQRMDAKNLNVIFIGRLPAVCLPRTEFAEGIREGREGTSDNSTDKCTNEEEDATRYSHDSPTKMHRVVEEIARVYEYTIRAIRAQDEHYARNTKLFSSRILESHEVSVVPTHFLAQSSTLVASATTTISSVGANSLGSLSQGGMASADSTTAFQNGDLGIINGARRFSQANVCPVKLTALQHRKPGLETVSGDASQTSWLSAGSVPSDTALDQIALLHPHDFDISVRHSRAFFIVFLSHLVSEFGSLLFSPADMSPFMHNAYVRESSAPTSELCALAPTNTTISMTSQGIDQGFHNIVLAYEAWNRLAGQMIEAEIVQNRGGSFIPSDTSVSPDLTEVAARRRASTPSSIGLPIRPKLQFHVEPLPQGILMMNAKEKDNTGGGGGTSSPKRPSITVGETFHSARIRRLSINDAMTLTQCVENIHCVIKSTSARLQEFNVVRRQLSEFRQLQWEQASELASQFASLSSVSSSSSPQATALGVNAPTSPPGPVLSTSYLIDERKHVFECISFANPVIERIFSVEENPRDELERVRAILERKKHLVRHLYTKYRPHIQHAVSLDDLWHFVKVLRFLKEIHMLPAMRDEDMAANGFEQLFSPDDLAEILLHLCNEQFLPQITPLSARVEYFVMHHLPFAVQNQSIIRDVMHQQDVKRALADHSQTIRIIFRRYCAKERDIGGLAHSQQQQQQQYGLGGGGSVATTVGTGKSGQHYGHRHMRHTGHGIAKFMRLTDWLAFIQDYNLLRPRFPLDYAVTVFRNVQEVASGRSGASGDDVDEQYLKMIYSEFCEALVSVAACYFPDPFLKSATKVSQFVQRFLPVSPEEVSSHAKT